MGVTESPAAADERPIAGGRVALRIAVGLFIAHIALIAFSTVALTTFLAGPPPEWLRSEPNATAMRLGWKYSGPTYVVLGGLAILAHAIGSLGARRAIALFAASATLTLGAELLGTTTGVPFGSYEYTSLLGFRIAGRVPLPIPISWFYMLYGSLAICGRLLPARDDLRMKLWWAMAAGLVLTAWDVAMDPAMVKTFHWIWHTPGVWYGMPLTNWLGWWITGTGVALAMLLIAPPTVFAQRISPTTLPLAVYLVNGIMPVAICLRNGLWWAAGLGALAMFIPARLAAGKTPEGVAWRVTHAES